ncbi:hypothetical protein [Couchioplanes azureus]|uniref:hypothetical protein n=1 Tax=Couchioplanes caeruleus TaxID=56438 RepID=UPI0016713423|nr:hypothetical protein [Couchioplanes caeruleus]
MASKMTNSAIEALRRRHAAEHAALKAATDAGAAVRRVQERRAGEMARWDGMVAEAERGADVALAVLASLMASDVAAALTQETPTRVRLGQQRAPVDEVTARLGELTDGVPVTRRRGRPRGSARSARPAVAVGLRSSLDAAGGSVAPPTAADEGTGGVR